MISMGVAEYCGWLRNPAPYMEDGRLIPLQTHNIYSVELCYQELPTGAGFRSHPHFEVNNGQQ